jgi:hypothetical protein
MATPKNEVTLDRRGAALAALSILLTAAYQSLWYVAPNVLHQHLWTGSVLNVGFALGTLSVVAPIVIAWLMVRSEGASDMDQTFETSGH